jgi:hypothetical protein
MSIYRKLPIEIEALEWTGINTREMYNFLGGNPEEYMTSYNENFYISHAEIVGGLIIKTSEGDMKALKGDYIIKEPFDKKRKYYPCKPDIFEYTYELVK